MTNSSEEISGDSARDLSASSIVEGSGDSSLICDDPQARDSHSPARDPMTETSRVDVSGTSLESLLVEMAEGLKALTADQAELREMFESKIRSDEIQAKALEKLHDQLRDYKANFVRQEMLPLLRDLIYCYDVADDEAVRARSSGGPGADGTASSAFDHLRQMVADVLAKYDVEPFRISGPLFDRREQQCVRTVPTSDASEDKKVAVAGAIGFRLGDQIIRKEQVVVYKYAPAAL